MYLRYKNYDEGRTSENLKSERITDRTGDVHNSIHSTFDIQPFWAHQKYVV